MHCSDHLNEDFRHALYITDMAPYHIAVALAGATFSLLLVLQLTSTFGLPQIDFLSLRYDAPTRGSPFNQIPINYGVPDPEVLEDDGLYLLGVGKADITGYVNRR